MALCGKRCLVLTNGGMVEHSINRTNDYTEKSGIEINIGIHNGGELLPADHSFQ